MSNLWVGEWFVRRPKGGVGVVSFTELVIDCKVSCLKVCMAFYCLICIVNQYSLTFSSFHFLYLSHVDVSLLLKPLIILPNADNCFPGFFRDPASYIKISEHC